MGGMRRVSYVGEGSFFESAVLAQANITNGMALIMATPGGDGAPAGGGGRRGGGGGPGGMGGGPGGGMGGPPDMGGGEGMGGPPPNMGGGGASRGGTRGGPGGMGGGMPGYALTVSFTNRGKETIEFTIIDVKSKLGNFVPQPARLALAPGQTTALLPMWGNLLEGMESIELTLTIRRGEGEPETRVITLALSRSATDPGTGSRTGGG
jgi:hypothetical protein